MRKEDKSKAFSCLALLKNKSAPKAKAAGHFICNAVFPPKCLSCGELHTEYDMRKAPPALCDVCGEKLNKASRLACKHCGQSFLTCTCASDILVENGVIKIMKFSGYFPDRQDSPELALLYRLKKKGIREATELVAEKLTEVIIRNHKSYGGYTVTYPPRSRKNIKKYGFDHTEMLARRVASKLNIPFEATAKRTGKAKEQKGLTAEERRENAFGTLTPIKGINSAGKRYIIVDDVLTTGASVAAMADLLHKNGAAETVAAVFLVRS